MSRISLLVRGFGICHFCLVQMLPKFAASLYQLQLEQASAREFKISILGVQICAYTLPKLFAVFTLQATLCSAVSGSSIGIGFWCCICRRELTCASKSVLYSPAGVSFFRRVSSWDDPLNSSHPRVPACSVIVVSSCLSHGPFYWFYWNCLNSFYL